MAGRDASRANETSRAPKPRTAERPGSQPSASPLADAQAAIGNRALAHRLAGGVGPAQAKLEVSGPTDAHEREADRVADAVTSMPEPAAQRQTDADEVEDIDEEEVATRLDRQADAGDMEDLEDVEEDTAAARLDRQAEPDDLDDVDELEESVAPKAAGAPSMTPGTESAIDRSRGAGRPLGGDSRGFFEPRFGRDLRDVRVHTDPSAARLASDLGAQAFTVGRDIYFAEGRYQPGTDSGRSLLAHELTHTVQQRPGAKLADDAEGRPAEPGPAGEHVQRQADSDTDSGGNDTNGGGDSDGGEGGASSGPTPEEGRVEGGGDPRTITYPKLRLPDFKVDAEHRKALYEEAAGGGNLRRSSKFTRGTPDQRRVWRDGLSLPYLRKVIATQIGEDNHDPDDRSRVYVLEHEQSKYRLIGTINALAREARFPYWSPKGQPDPKDVDHIVELQVSGWADGKASNSGKGISWANKTENMELLDNRANQQSGSSIDAELDRLAKKTASHYWQSPEEASDSAEEEQDADGGGRADDVIAQAVATDPGFWTAPTMPKAEDVKGRYDLAFEGVTGGLAQHGDPDNHWLFEDVESGEHLAGFQAVEDLESEEGWLAYPFSSGGIPASVIPSGQEESDVPDVMGNEWFAPFRVDSYLLEEDAPAASGDDEIGWAKIEAEKKSGGRGYYALFPSDGGEAEIPMLRFGGIPNAAYVKHRSLLRTWISLAARQRGQAELEGMSPVDFHTVELVPGAGFHAEGTVLPDVPIMADLGIDLVVDGDAVFLAKRFDVGDFDLPGPIEVTHSTVQVTAGTDGLGAGGDLGLAIDGVGTGLITARIDTDSGFALAGTFDFDPELFDPPSQIELGYEDGEFSGSGTLSIGENRVRGVKSASIETSYAGGRLDAQGDAELDVPGLERGTMSLSYSEVEGFALGGSFDISSDVPGLSDGSVSAEVRHDPEEGYEVSASGTAVPDIPGVSARVDVAYEDGIFLAEGTAGYERGMLSGSLTVGATNETLDDDDNPTGEAGDTLRAFGGGSLTLALAPWLEATAGVRLTADGEVEVTGRVGLPAALEVFPERRYDRNLLSIDVDIPIVGVTVPIIRRNIGIFASIGGGLDLTAGFGPGELRDLGLEVTYNPEREEDTEVTGGAEFVVPADAGLRLFVRGALGAGIPVVDARVGLEVGGGLGLNVEARAGVEVAWTPSDGIELSAEAEISGEPKLKLDITGFASVEADVGLKSFDLYSERWDLAGFEHGSGLRLGATFPIEYVEGEPFDMSMDDIEFQVPDVDPQALLSGVVDEFT